MQNKMHHARAKLGMQFITRIIPMKLIPPYQLIKQTFWPHFHLLMIKLSYTDYYQMQYCPDADPSALDLIIS